MTTQPSPSTISTETASAAQPASLTRIIFRNTVVVSAGALLVKLLNVVFNIVMTRWLGETGIGHYATVISFVGLFGVFFEMGLSQYVERSIAQDRTRTRSLFWSLLALRLLLALLGLALIPLLAITSGYDRTVIIGTTLYAATFVFAAVLTPLVTVLQAHERFDAVSLASVASQVVTVALGFVMLWSGYGFLGLLCIGFVAMPLHILIAARAVRRANLGSLRFEWSPSTWPSLIRASVPFGLTSLALMLNFSADNVILGWFHAPGVVGWYSAAYRLVFSLVGLLTGFLTVCTPSLAREHTSNPERVRAWTHTATTWLMAFALPCALGTALLAPRLVAMLYGAAFEPSGALLATLCWDVPLLLFTAFCGNVTAAVGLERPAARIFTASVVLNVLLNLAFIPAFGAPAAAVITVGTDAMSAVAFMVLLHQHMRLGDIAPQLGRAAVAAAGMGTALWAFASLPLFVLIGVGAAAYVVLALALGLMKWYALVAFARRVLRRS